MLLGHDAFLINFLSGAVAGTVASTITLPFDVVKTTKQIELGETMIGGGSTGFSSFFICQEKILNNVIQYAQWSAFISIQ